MCDTQREHVVDEALLKQQREIDKINAMTHLEMARRYRFAVDGDPYFDNTLPYYEVFNERFKMLGGFTPEISKEIGWKR